jgi:hypothetical protein
MVEHAFGKVVEKKWKVVVNSDAAEHARSGLSMPELKKAAPPSKKTNEA